MINALVNSASDFHHEAFRDAAERADEIGGPSADRESIHRNIRR